MEKIKAVLPKKEDVVKNVVAGGVDCKSERWIFDQRI